jgi:hypothetical protein
VLNLVSVSFGFILPTALQGALVTIVGVLGVHVVYAIEVRRIELMRRIRELLLEAVRGGELKTATRS